MREASDPAAALCMACAVYIVTTLFDDVMYVGHVLFRSLMIGRVCKAVRYGFIPTRVPVVRQQRWKSLSGILNVMEISQKVHTIILLCKLMFLVQGRVISDPHVI